MDSDQELLQKYIKSRDAAAFAELVSRYAPMVYATCLRIARNRTDAEDAAQESLLQLARTPEIISGHLGGWLYRTARNRAIDQIRSAAIRKKYEDAASAPQSSPATPIPAAEHVDGALAELEEDLREPLILHFLRGLSQQEVAAQLRLSQSTVSRRIEQALALLRVRLQSSGISLAPAAILASDTFCGQSPAALEVGTRVVAVVNSVTHASAASATAASLWTKGVLLAASVAVVTGGIFVVGRAHNGELPATVPSPLTPIAQVPVPSSSIQTSGMRISLPNQGTVELLGITSSDDPRKRWWGPDGQLLAAAPLSRSGLQTLDSWAGQRRCEFVLAVTGNALGQGYFWDFPGQTGSQWTGNPPWSGLLPRSDLREARAAFLPGQRTATVRYGLTSGKVETLLEAGIGGDILAGGESVWITDIRPEGQRTIINLTIDPTVDAGCLPNFYVVTTDGRRVERQNSNRNPTATGVTYELTFGIPSNQVEKILVLVRRYTHWIVYENVPLEPGVGAAKVRVETLNPR